ncbi:hypothetical protein VPNG_05279 [Cytospora leucostoma]|uniref:Uncharacterized protein n=1 Tax=Cytospora leucostoma TaxID=1230097 RepID=A0A423X7K4_9PEZI|nr:hypothetical protein VPNG_05279 [Cytospora leucostoma]
MTTATYYNTPQGATRSILVFGPQALSFNKQSLGKLRRLLWDDGSSRRRWVLRTVADLPRFWRELLKKIPEVADVVPGEKLLAELISWLRHGPGDDDQEGIILPNMILTPLVVLSQLTQYWRYLESIGPGVDGDLHAALVSGQNIETLGFCAGLLSAFAVASSSSGINLERYGATAVRLAMLVGALVDAQEAWNDKDGRGRSRSYATAWQNTEQRIEMDRIIQNLTPEAYVSVLYDESRATVTTSDRVVSQLLQQLRTAGITVAEVGLRGRFHSPDNTASPHVDSLIELCASIEGLQLAHPEKAALRSYTNSASVATAKGMAFLVANRDEGLHEVAIRSMLVHQCDWYGSFNATKAEGDAVVVSFGQDRCVPPTLLRCIGPRLQHFNDLEDDEINMTSPQPKSRTRNDQDRTAKAKANSAWGEDAVAVVGMSIKVAGADDVDEFAQMLCTGESQHEGIGPDRLMFDTLFRTDDGGPARKWYGNFIRGVDEFDHKFFKRSPREAATMDPQQRLFLQAAYQAVESSGYFTEPESIKDGARDKRHIGVFLGACAGDYEHHAACHPANAFTATGNLKSFITGKVSHYFGWTGPSITFDTACSASAVALHTACRNILSGDCTAALAGGIAAMTNFLWFQNLAGASFLSPTGQCKPFDNEADGYCRGEGVACVFLKRMSDAIADGNQIHACIASSAVYQNQNCTPLFVPNSPSLSKLFCDVICKAKLDPSDVSFVEAHGTGTPVGDPAEYESIRMALAGPTRSKKLMIGSVKGHIGHTEGASGIVSLVKVIAMMQGGFFPPQASFTTISNHIPARPDDMIEVATSLRPWDEEHKAALINNYGASGSNASILVTQSPQDVAGAVSATIRTDAAIVDIQRFPFWIAGLDVRSISSYCTRLSSYIEKRPDITLADVSFHMNRQSNRSLAYGLIFGCRSLPELVKTLEHTSKNPLEAGIAPMKTARSVILCFGGQVSTFVGLDRKLYDSITLLRHHLDKCDAVVRASDLGSIYPGIFSSAPMNDTVALQVMLFAIQYASARSWLDSLLRPNQVASVVGHSFGEITALCVSGVLGLEDAVKLVAGRARLVHDAWEADPGAMLAVEADEALIRQLLFEANVSYGGNRPATIACYNGPRSFTLAGATRAIGAVVEKISCELRFSGIKNKKLNVTNAFHSTLVEPLVESLKLVGKDIDFRDPIIPFERTSEQKFTGKITSNFVAEQMRQPVFFNHAIQRLAEEHPSAIFLEAGSNSTVTIMASRALGRSEKHYFQAINITNNDKALESLTDATVSLWKRGLGTSFWAHHSQQTHEYAQLHLPPYQFEKSRHWMEMRSPLEAVQKAAAKIVVAQGVSPVGQKHQEEKGIGLWTFEGYQSAEKGGCRPRFRINTDSNKYKCFMSGHLIVQTAPICPATLEVDMAIEALFSLHPDWKVSNMQPVVLGMLNHAPLCVDPSRTVWLDFEAIDDELVWAWKVTSVADASDQPQTHVEARLHIHSPTDVAYQAAFDRFERAVSHERCLNLLRLGLENGDKDVLSGRNVYRAFSEIVDYPDVYRGVKTVVGHRGETAGRVVKKHSGETWLDVPLSDSFSQVAGIWVNCMTDRNPNDMYIATGCESTMRSPRMAGRDHGDWPDTWHVFARHTRQSEKLYTSDVFVFDSLTGMLTEVMLGIQYARVSKASMSKILTRLTADESMLKVKAPVATVQLTTAKAEAGPAIRRLLVQEANTSDEKKGRQVERAKPSSRPDITEDVRNLVSNVTGVEGREIGLDSELADFGIDSLMGMELAREVETVFKCTLDQLQLMEARSLRNFIVCISNALYGEGLENGETRAAEDNDDDFDNDDLASQSTLASMSTGTGNSTPAESKEKPSVLTPVATVNAPPAVSNLTLSPAEVLQSFREVKILSDAHIREHSLDNIEQDIIAATNRLCAALVVEAFDELGCPLRAAKAGDVLAYVPFLPQHRRLIQFVYEFLERDARLLDFDAISGRITRTSIAAPHKPSHAVLQELLGAYPEFAIANNLTYYAGRHLADVLSGKTDGIRVIFGSVEGRERVQALYCEHTFNRMHYGQMKDVIGRLIERVRYSQPGETIKILEMGAGTGGTTRILAPFLASLEVPVEYTFTDLSASMVANARRIFGKLYPFMRFAVHDIESLPAEELQGNHIVLASNAIHATHNLVTSLTNVRSALRPDGFFMMLEMTEVVPFIDLIFGLLEGWWLFDDGRKHAIISAEDWEHNLYAAGFSFVDWTDGSLPENNFQKVLIALPSAPIQERLPISGPEHATESMRLSADAETAREKEAEEYVKRFSDGWAMLEPAPQVNQSMNNKNNAVVIVTGATGSLGSHIVAGLAEHADVKTVVCMNRRSSTPAERRQLEALAKRGIRLSDGARSKLRMLEIDSSRPKLGLPGAEYAWLERNGTHIIHNAWPMSGTRPVRAFESHFQALRHLLDLARDIASRSIAPRVGFQFVSSIGVVGFAGEGRVRERRVPLSAAMPIGYCEAKWVCERLLDETLHRNPERFRAMVVRPGQIAGSSTSGFWNPVEHFAFMVKSAQSLRAWPDLDGILQWVPVDHCAGTMVDLLAIGNDNAPDPYPVYHIDNPVGQPWKDMSPVLASALGIPPSRFVPFRDWCKLVRRSPLPLETENPARRLVDWLEHNFERMSCGGLILETVRTQEHSKTMAELGPVSPGMARRFVASWKEMGYLMPV